MDVVAYIQELCEKAFVRFLKIPKRGVTFQPSELQQGCWRLHVAFLAVSALRNRTSTMHMESDSSPCPELIDRVNLRSRGFIAAGHFSDDRIPSQKSPCVESILQILNYREHGKSLI